MFSVLNRLDIGKYKWDDVVNISEEGWLFHLYDFQEITKTWGREDISFGITDREGNILCIFPLQIKSVIRKIAKVARLETVGSMGPAFLPVVRYDERKLILDYIKNYLMQVAGNYGAYEIRLSLPALAPNQRRNNPSTENSLLLLGCKNIQTQTYIVDLKKNKEQIWDKMKTRCRTAIRKAEKNGYEIKKAVSIKDIELYYELHKETYHRTGAKPHAFEYFKSIWDYFGKSEIANFFLAVKDGKYVAGQLIGVFKEGGFYWAGASKMVHAKMGINNLLLWHAIVWARERGCEWFECGEAFPNLLNGKMKGINDFKRSFGGELHPYYKGQIVFKPFLKYIIDFMQDKKIMHLIRRNLK